jgi:GNAT superfamily N-acetyltransferase
MNLRYQKAGLAELPLLVKTRLISLRAANKLPPDADMSAVVSPSEAYYRQAIPAGDHVAYLVYDGEAVVGTGAVSFFQVMPTYSNPSGRKAYIMNLYTHPDYRRCGIAYHTLSLLVEEAKSRGISSISLDATDMGRPLYEKFGFVPMESELTLPKIP